MLETIKVKNAVSHFRLTKQGRIWSWEFISFKRIYMAFNNFEIKKFIFVIKGK